jgi:cell division septation protein DedD
MMTERRYGLRFSGAEGGLLFGGMLLASFLVFVSGVYVGREVAGRKGNTQGPIVRVPVSPFANSNDTLTNNTTKVATNTPLAWPTLKERSTTTAPSTTKSEELQLKERTRMNSLPTYPNAPTAFSAGRRTTEEGKEGQSPRPKPELNPFIPQLPVAAASRNERNERTVVPQSARFETKLAASQNSRPEAEGRKSTVESPRSETTEKKSSTVVTVANVEKFESSVRSREQTLERKKTRDGKSNETKPALTTAKKTSKQAGGWRVQVGATTYPETANDMARELRGLGYDPTVTKVQMNGETLYRVRVGKFGKQGEAVAAVSRFRREGRFSQAYPVSE